MNTDLVIRFSVYILTLLGVWVFLFLPALQEFIIWCRDEKQPWFLFVGLITMFYVWLKLCQAYARWVWSLQKDEP